MVYVYDCATNCDILAVGDNRGNIYFFNSQGEKLQSQRRPNGCPC